MLVTRKTEMLQESNDMLCSQSNQAGKAQESSLLSPRCLGTQPPYQLLLCLQLARVHSVRNPKHSLASLQPMSCSHMPEVWFGRPGTEAAMEGYRGLSTSYERGAKSSASPVAAPTGPSFGSCLVFLEFTAIIYIQKGNKKITPQSQ